jgi:hypothetical protein
METINKIVLSDPDRYPDDELLQQILGKSYPAFRQLTETYEKNRLTMEWRYYLDGKSWLCKVQHKKRTIVWMSVWKGYVQATVYVPEKYLNDLCKLDLFEETKERIRQTKNVGKSKPCIFEIRTKKVIEELLKVMRFKQSVK